MWFAVQLDPGWPTYNVPYRIRFVGDLDPARLRRAVTDIVDRHESLRTTFRYQKGKLWQLVHPTPDLQLPVLDLRDTPDAELRAASVAEQEARQLFDLETGPLLRLRLAHLPGGRHELLLVCHHLIFDGWSTSLLLDELAEAYSARVSDRQPQLPALEIQYADFAQWQQQRLTHPETQQLLEYWRDHLRGVPQVLRLAGGDHNGAGPSSGGIETMRVPAGVLPAVQELARVERTTPFVVMLTAFAALLASHTGQPDLVIGSPAASRPRPETAALIGLFVNMLPLRADLRDAPTYRQLLGRLRRSVLDGFARQLPLEQIVADLRPERRQARSPLFQVIFWLRPEPERLAVGPLTAEVAELSTGTAKYDLALGVRLTGEDAECEFTYRRAALDQPTVAGLAAQYQAIVEAMTADPDQPVARQLPASPDPVSAPETGRTTRPSTPASPPGEARRAVVERAVADIWCAALEVPQVGRDENFFDLGGHSRLMVQVRERLVETFDRPITMLDLFEYPTVAAIADYLMDGRDHAGDPDHP